MEARKTRQANKATAERQKARQAMETRQALEAKAVRKYQTVVKRARKNREKYCRKGERIKGQELYEKVCERARDRFEKDSFAAKL